MTDSPSPFSTTIPDFQIAWDSTSLGWLKKCPRLYQYQMVEGWAPRSKGIHLAFGGWYASGVERYAHSRAAGVDHEAAVLAMVKWAMLATGEHSAEGEWLPWESGDEYKNRYTLIRSLIWNVDDWKDSPWETVILANGKPAVELSFNFPVFELDGETISLSGHMDKLVTNHGQTFVMDDKTTRSQLNAQYFSQYSPHNQMTLYTIAGKVVYNQPVQGVLVRAAQIQVNGTRFATQQATRPEAVLTEWLADFRHYVTLARQFAVNGYWPMNDTACNDYGGCPFRKVCSVSPAHRKSWLQQDFIKRQWNPLQARGDI